MQSLNISVYIVSLGKKKERKNGKDDKLARKLPYLYSKQRFENTVEERESGLSRLIVESNVLPFFPHCPSDITHLSRKSVCSIRFSKRGSVLKRWTFEKEIGSVDKSIERM